MKVQTSLSKIPCKICGHLFHSINNTHLGSRHHIKVDEYQKLYGGQIKSEEYKKIAYRNHSSIMRQLRKSGVVTPPKLSEKARLNISTRMKLNNPMKDPTIAKRVGDKLKGKPTYQRNLEHRLMQRKLKLGSNNPNFNGGESREYVLWKKDRLTALNTHGEYCAMCGMTMGEHKNFYGRGLHVHHIKRDKPLDNSIQNTIVLCNKCHQSLHALSKRERMKLFNETKNHAKVNLEGRKKDLE